MNHDEEFFQRIVVTLDIPGGPGTEIIAAGVLLDLLNHFQHDGIQAHRITLEITDPTTTPQASPPTAPAPAATPRASNILNDRVAAVLTLTVGQHPAPVTQLTALCCVRSATAGLVSTVAAPAS
jgi:hypothetical protein